MNKLYSVFQEECPKTYFGGLFWILMMFLISILGILKTEIFQREILVSNKSWLDFFLSLLLFSAVLFVFDIFRRLRKEINFIRSFVFYFTIFWGSLVALNFLFPDIISLIVFFVVLLVYIFLRKVWIHNLLTVLGFAGIGAIIGSSFPPLVSFTFLFIFAIYVKSHNLYGNEKDFIGLIIPRKNCELKETLKKTERKYIVMKTGMFLMPVILFSSVAMTSLEKAVVVAAFSLVGFIVSSHLFPYEKKCSCEGTLMTVFFFASFGFLFSLLF